MSETSGETPDQPSSEQPANPYGQPAPPGGWPAPPPPPPAQPYQQPYAQQPYAQQPYGYGQPATPYGAPVYGVPDDKSATTALVLGIVGLALGFTLCLGVGFIVSPFALFTGLASKRRIDASGGQLGGRSNAQAGIVLGIIGTVMLALFILAVIAFVVLVVVGISQDSSSFGTGTNA